MTAPTAPATASFAVPPLTWLYVPGDRPAVVVKALASGADAVVIDLEDAVAADRKPYALRATAELLAEGRPVTPASAPGPAIHVRVNALTGPYAATEIRALAALPALAGLRLPKVNGSADIHRAAAWAATAGPGTAGPGSIAPGNANPDHANPDHASPGGAAPGSAIPGSANPGSAAPGGTAPGRAAPEPMAPGQTAPEQPSSWQTAPERTSPRQTASKRAAPGSPAPESPAAVPPLHALLETALGVENAFAVATAHPALCGLSLGEADLRAELGVRDEDGLGWARGRTVIAARAAGLPPPPQSVFPDVRDTEALALSCARGRALGFLGRAALHPRQLPVIERAYLPTAEEVARAMETVQAAAAGAGACALPDGRFVDPAVVAAARRVLTLAARGPRCGEER
ncbi:aldolase/citrate lyase family protein [Streptomyces sp. NPDC018045]|uniref:HpcH/HpaI aldolase/citrate lyase family protein n=1 Tax=Streptomyces sp. NPDC018045 TaxID=3365037 RepID=UPI00378FCDAF